MTSIQQNEKQHSESPQTTQAFIVGFWGVRYQVKDVQRAITFYTQTLGFNLDMQSLPAFGQVSIGGLKLILSGPGASGSRPMPDGRQQEPGGWNRVLLQVQDLPARIADLKEAGLRFRNEMEVGPGGKQIQIEEWRRLYRASRLGGLPNTVKLLPVTVEGSTVPTAPQQAAEATAGAIRLRGLTASTPTRYFSATDAPSARSLRQCGASRRPSGAACWVYLMGVCVRQKCPSSLQVDPNEVPTIGGCGLSNATSTRRESDAYGFWEWECTPSLFHEETNFRSRRDRGSAARRGA